MSTLQRKRELLRVEEERIREFEQIFAAPPGSFIAVVYGGDYRAWSRATLALSPLRIVGLPSRLRAFGRSRSRIVRRTRRARNGNNPTSDGDGPGDPGHTPAGPRSGLGGRRRCAQDSGA